MCLVLFAWATNQTFFKDLTDTDFRKKLLEDREKLITDDILPFGFVDDGSEFESENRINNYDDNGSWYSDIENKWTSW